MPFAYLRDPLFIGCFVVYWGHRFLAIHGVSLPIFRAYLNDVICIPFWVPIMLWVQRVTGLRRHDGPPYGHEIVIPLLILSVVFEVALPATRTWLGRAVADPNDVLCYAVGGLGAAIYWRWRYAHGGHQSSPSWETSTARPPFENVKSEMRDLKSQLTIAN